MNHLTLRLPLHPALNGLIYMFLYKLFGLGEQFLTLIVLANQSNREKKRILPYYGNWMSCWLDVVRWCCRLGALTAPRPAGGGG